MKQTDRRSFLSRVSLALGALAASIGAVPPFLYVVGPLFKKKGEIWRPVGSVGGFGLGETTEVVFPNPEPEPWAEVAALSGAWLRRESDTEFIAFSVDCTHLGCPVRWLADADLFMCPCHGGVFYSDGRVASGPPEQPLRRYPVRVRNGQVEVSTSPLPIMG